MRSWGAAACVLLPFLGTAVGAGAVFFLRREGKGKARRGMLGFAAGVMLAASVWSLLIPAIQLAEEAGRLAWGPAVLGFLAGMGCLLRLDGWLSRVEEGALRGMLRGHRPANLMLLLAVTVHNFPEGMAVGVALAGAAAGRAGITAAGAAALSIGIAVQNLPEGAIISVPLAAGGMKQGKAFVYGTLSGAVEPAGAALMMALTRWLTPVLPYVLAFAAGTMLYVVVVELVPETQKEGGGAEGPVGTALGFALMMLLDVALG